LLGFVSFNSLFDGVVLPLAFFGMTRPESEDPNAFASSASTDNNFLDFTKGSAPRIVLRPGVGFCRGLHAWNSLCQPRCLWPAKATRFLHDAITNVGQ
jgi:hypothetical protein